MKRIPQIITLWILLTIIGATSRGSDIIEAWKVLREIKKLNQIEPALAVRGAMAFWRFKDPGIARVLIDGLEITPPVVQHFFIRKLGELQNKEAVGKLMYLAQHGVPWWVRSVAIEALGNIRSHAAIPVLLEALTAERLLEQKRALRALHDITGHGRKLSLKSKPNETASAIAYWQKWGKIKRNYPPPPPDDLPYLEPNYQFTISKPAATWDIEVGIDEKQRLIFHLFPQPNIIINIWAEEKFSQEQSLRQQVLTLENKYRRKEVQAYRRILLTPSQQNGYRGFLLHYQGKSHNIMHDYENAIFFSRSYIYNVLMRASPPQYKMGRKYLQHLLRYFTIFSPK